MRFFADDQNRIWTVALADYVLMADMMRITSTRHGACTSYDIRIPLFDQIGSGPLFRLPPKILNALTYFDAEKTASQAGTDPVLTGLPFHRFGKVDWSNTPERNGFVFYEFPTREVYGLSEELYKQGSA